MALAGFAIAFRQAWVRALLRRLRGKGPSPLRAADADPAYHLMLIAGTMLMAFGLLMFAFTTLYALMD